MKRIVIFVAIMVSSVIGVKKTNIDVNNCELLIDDIEMLALAQQESPSNKSGSITIQFDANRGSSNIQNKLNTSVNSRYSSQNDSASVTQFELEKEMNNNNSDTTATLKKDCNGIEIHYKSMPQCLDIDLIMEWNGVEMTADQATEILKAFLH
ncbi:MAG: hypothetical protein MJ211_10320 [Bacteroidales bacterium]|nr:hypothetical protein [Bacteroidales bacterium]